MSSKILSKNVLCNKENISSPCNSKKNKLKRCLKENDYNMDYCNNQRLVYELCLLKNKQYRLKIRD